MTGCFGISGGDNCLAVSSLRPVLVGDHVFGSGQTALAGGYAVIFVPRSMVASMGKG